MSQQLSEDELTDIELWHFRSRTTMRLIAAIRQARGERDAMERRAETAEGDMEVAEAERDEARRERDAWRERALAAEARLTDICSEWTSTTRIVSHAEERQP